MIISGGYPSSSGLKVEVFNINQNKSCRLDDLPVIMRGDYERYHHSQCGHLLCGGNDFTTYRSCLMLNPLTGVFSPTSVTLRERRDDHLCWDVEGENGPVLLMGGDSESDDSNDSERSTELVSSDGLTSSASFNLKYNTVYSINISNYIFIIFIQRGLWD